MTSAGAILLARQFRPVPGALVRVTVPEETDCGDRFEVADAAALPWSDGQIDLIVCSPPYALGLLYQGGDPPDYVAWLRALHGWLTELLRIAHPDWGRLCLNVPLDRDLGGWQPVSADAIHVARGAGWQFRTWVLWDKGQAGAGTDRGSVDSAATPNVTAPVESVLVFYRGQWKRSGPASMPHEAWLELCGPRGLWRFPGTSDPLCPAPFPELLPERCYPNAASRCSVFLATSSLIRSSDAVPPRLWRPDSTASSGHQIEIPRVWRPRRHGLLANVPVSGTNPPPAQPTTVQPTTSAHPSPSARVSNPKKERDQC